jgi:hypothetical protein
LAVAPAEADDAPAISRRGMLGKALGAAAAGVAGVALLEPGSPAAATDGNPVNAGATTLAEHETQVKYDGAGSFTGVVLLGNDSTYDGSNAVFPAAVGGWAGAVAHAGAGGVTSGVYGYSEHGAGYGVVGYLNRADAGTGGAAVYGVSTSTAGGASAVRGEITSSSPGGFSAAVRGVNDGSGGNGIGVYGSHAGSGWGVYGASDSGIGVNAIGATGVSGTGDAYGVRGENSASGPGVYGHSVHGRGGVFGGPKAQIQLQAGTRTTHPTAGARGDLYVDHGGRLWYCKTGGAHATWRQLA